MSKQNKVGISHYFSASYDSLHHMLTTEMQKTCQSAEIEYSKILHHVENNLSDLSAIKMNLSDVKQDCHDIKQLQTHGQDDLQQYLIDLSQQPTLHDWYQEVNNHVASCIQEQMATLKKDIITRSRSEKHSILVVIITCFLAVTAFLFLIVSGKFLLP